MQKRCSKCSQFLDISLFHKDSTAKDGHASSCRTCRNASKARRAVKNPSVVVPSQKEAKAVPVTMEEENIFKRLSEKHGAFYTICVESTGKCQVQVFKGPPKILRGENFDVESVMMELVR